MRQKITVMEQCCCKEAKSAGWVGVGRRGTGPDCWKRQDDSSALEANVGRMPRYDTGPTVSGRFQLVHTQEPVLGQGTPSFWYRNALPFVPRCFFGEKQGRMAEFVFDIYFKEDRWNLETGLKLFLASSTLWWTAGWEWDLWRNQ